MYNPAKARMRGEEITKAGIWRRPAGEVGAGGLGLGKKGAGSSTHGAEPHKLFLDGTEGEEVAHVQSAGWTRSKNRR
jgi:hypothetical protein